MQIEDLPYPVYCEGSPDYIGVVFSVDLEQVESDDPLHFTIQGRFNIQNYDIRAMIEKGDAGFGLLIECSQTDYYEFRPCTARFRENLIKAYFADVVTISPVIYAKREIPRFYNADLIEELKKQYITMPEGAIIAADGEIELTITRSQPQTVESICKLRPAITPGYDIEGDTIILQVPEEVYQKYRKMTKNQKIEVTSIYFPAVLQSIISNNFVENTSEYADRRWYGAIKDALYARGIDPRGQDPYIIMMAVIGDLMTEGVSFIPIQESESQ